MLEFNISKEINLWSKKQRENGLSIGFVPTMGALHEGHLSLIRIARAKNDIVVSSIFVNPTQFNNKRDLEKYPISIAADKEMLESEGCDAVFIPSRNEIYPSGEDYDLDVDLGYIGECMEASHRPGHFEGVMQVVKLLLEIVEPDILFLGRKDYQQYRVVKRMVETYNLPLEVEQCPIIREEDGLAMSSRNRRLTAEERAAGLLLSRALFQIKENWKNDSPDHLTKIYTHQLNSHKLIDVEYLEIADNETLRPVKEWSDSASVIVCIAAIVGEIRLIDNATIY